MAVTYGFFDSRNGDRKYNADQMSEYFRGIVSGGVFQHLDGGLQVTAGTGLSVNVAAGRAIVQNRWIQNSASLPLSISAASETYGRKDAVVLRLDSSARTVSITVKTGTPAASPAAPSMTRSGGVYEMALAYVNVAAGATSVTVTDKRSDSSVCGWAAVAQAASGEVDQMLNDMKTGFDGVEYPSPAAMVQGEDQKLQTLIDQKFTSNITEHDALVAAQHMSDMDLLLHIGYLSINNEGKIKSSANSNFRYTYIRVNEGDVYFVTYKSKVSWNVGNAIYFVDSNGVVIGRAGERHYNDVVDGIRHSVTVKVPAGAFMMYTETYLAGSDPFLSVKRVNSDMVYPLQPRVVLGSLTTTTGVTIDSTTRIRCADYETLNEPTIYIISDSGYKAGVRFYDENKNFIYEYNMSFSNDVKIINSVICPNAKYFKWVAAYSDNREIDDIYSVANHITTLKSRSDSGLSLMGYPAEATTVNKEITQIRSVLDTDSIRILGIGNSYTRDCLRWVWKICKELGYANVIVGHGYIGGITLQEQYESIDSAGEYHSSYQYWKYSNSQDATKTSQKTLDEILADEPWDYVVFQQQSDEAGQYNSFVNDSFDINDFIAHVKSVINNDNLKIGIDLTWSHATGYTGTKFIEYYHGSPSEQLAAIKNVIPQVANHMTQCNFIVNLGNAVEIGRNNAYLNAIGVEMLRSDKNHLEYGIPSMMAGLIYVKTITGKNISKIYWYPTAEDEGVQEVTASDYLLFLAKQCVDNACLIIDQTP